MIEIDLSRLQKAEHTIHIKGHQTKTGYVKPHTRKVKTATEADVEMDVKLAALRDYKEAAMRTEDWLKENPDMNQAAGVVNNFTVDEYDDINKFLRGDEPEDLTKEEIIESVDAISGFLRDAPKFNGTVYRGMGFDPTVSREKDIYDKFMGDVQNTDTVTLPAFTSTTFNKDKAVDFSGEGVPKYTARIILEIKSKRGVALNGVAAFPKEQEILFDKSSDFKVIGVKNIDGIDHIQLEEI